MNNSTTTKPKTNIALLNQKMQGLGISIRQLSIMTGINEQTLYNRFDESIPEIKGKRRFHDNEIGLISEAMHLTDYEIYQIFIVGHM